MGLTVAILGSYRKHFKQIITARKHLIEGGIDVLLPIGGIVDEKSDFVALSSDGLGQSPEEIESEVIDKALGASFIYFVCPDGYIGRTASYELGRLTQAGKMIFFSQKPSDLPIFVSDEAVVSVDSLISGLKNGTINL